MVSVFPFPPFPAIPWTAEQIKEYEQQQKARVPDAPM